ncbi:MAG: hypothetical protein K9N51_03080 [Candidatus Pacebacteria bacterium]|nr:hypothetical protein [Candidatus Paceibacterota bacterium]
MTQHIDLNGTWDFVADLDPKYHAIHGGFQTPDANRRHWQKVPVPGVWQKYAERYDIFEGVCWFAREFTVSEAATVAIARLRFGAVNYLANMYLNGEKVGSHEGGYTEFALDVTGKLKPGVNHLAVQVDNRATTIKWPPCLGYFNYGGIHRGVSLEIIEGPALEDVRLEANSAENGWELLVRGRLADPSDKLIVRVSSDGMSWEDCVDEHGEFSTNVPCHDTPAWSPENPHLKPVVVELLDEARKILDRREYDFGFRTIAMQDGKVQLNGRPYPLKGVCYVYDSETTGLVMTPEQIETDLLLMKEAGCNAVRCHYPMDAAFYAACDRLGLLVWIEPPIYCYHPADDETGTRFADPEWLALAQKMAREMIAVARNHPSVAIYSIGNECNTTNTEAEPFFRTLATTIREADPTRLISYAALYGIVGPIADIVDVLGINSYWGWYDKIWGGKGLAPDDMEGERPRELRVEPIDLTPMREMLDKVLTEKTNLALLLTEFGADSVPGDYSSSRDLWSENYHAALLREILALAEDYPRIVGTFPFCFTDYRDPSKVHNGYWNELNLKGVVDYHRNKKLAYSALQTAYRTTAPGPVSEAAPASGNTPKMTELERVLATLNHQPVDRCAILEQLSYNPRVIADWTGKTIDGFNYTLDDICEVIRQTCDLAMPPSAPRGTGRVTSPDGFVTQHDNWTSWHVSRPFDDEHGAAKWLRQKIQDIKSTPLDPEESRNHYRQRMLDLQSKIGDTVILNFSLTGFCHPFDAMGLEIFTFFQLEYPELLKDYMETNVSREVHRVHAVADPGLSPVILIPEDFATKQGPIFPPDFLQEFHYPYIRKLADAWHEHDVHVLYHSDGNWKKAITELKACNVDGFYCLEPNCGMDIVELKNAHPDMVWAGGVDGVDLMERGTPQQVTAEVQRHIRETSALETGGMFVASSSEINPPIPPKNFRAMVESVWNTSRIYSSPSKA